MSWDDTLGNLRVLDKWRADAGLKYGIEQPAARPRTIRGAPLGAPGPTIPHAPDAGASQVGVAASARASRTFPTSPARRSCSTPSGRRAATCSTPAGSTAAAAPRRVLGEWLGARGVREAAVVIGKGAHSPLTYPDVIAQAARADARPARHRLRRRLLHAPRQPRRPRGRVRRRHGRRGARRADPRPDRRLELDARAAGRGQRLCRTHRQGPSSPRSRTTSRSPR